jgi:uncharacterized membrane protein YadS
VALATVFLLNAVALYLFPPIGNLLGLSQEQFALWAAIAIHDTSSVVGAAAAYGPEALQQATVLKLARALWIAPLTVGAAWYVAARPAAPAIAPAPGVALNAADGLRAEAPVVVEDGSPVRIKVPWFIGLFLLAAITRTLLPTEAAPLLDGIARGARFGLVLALYLIGAGLTRETLREVGPRPLAQGVLLWVIISGLTLILVGSLAARTL